MSETVAQDYLSDTGLDTVGVDCDTCDWEVTVGEIIRRIKDSPVNIYTAEYINQRLSSAGEGHAHFNRGHRISTHLSVAEIQKVTARSDKPCR